MLLRDFLNLLGNLGATFHRNGPGFHVFRYKDEYLQVGWDSDSSETGITEVILFLGDLELPENCPSVTVQLIEVTSENIGETLRQLYALRAKDASVSARPKQLRSRFQRSVSDKQGSSGSRVRRDSLLMNQFTFET